MAPIMAAEKVVGPAQVEGVGDQTHVAGLQVKDHGQGMAGRILGVPAGFFQHQAVFQVFWGIRPPTICRPLQSIISHGPGFGDFQAFLRAAPGEQQAATGAPGAPHVQGMLHPHAGDAAGTTLPVKAGAQNDQTVQVKIFFRHKGQQQTRQRIYQGGHRPPLPGSLLKNHSI